MQPRRSVVGLCRRWQIENEYKSIKYDFLAKTSSKDYRVRLFYFVFAVLLHNIWRLTDFLLKVGIDAKMDYAPVLTAGECVELVSSALIPGDQFHGNLGVPAVSGNAPSRQRFRGVFLMFLDFDSEVVVDSDYAG